MRNLSEQIDQFYKLAAMTRQEALALLGVAETATPEEIKRSYKHRILQMHPDRMGVLSPEKKEFAHNQMVALNAAKNTLDNPQSAEEDDLLRDMQKRWDEANIFLDEKQREADAWLEDVRKRREWSDYLSGELPVENLSFEENIANAPAIEQKRKEHLRRKEENKRRRQEKKK